jgi:hypothetical protein
VPARVDQSAEKKPLGDAEFALEECASLETELNELKANYEQFFVGIERAPPSKKHEGIKRRVAALKGLFIRQTALKFRVQAVTAKLVTWERLWDRTLKEIEAGTYKRDLFKARLHSQKRVAKPAAKQGEAPAEQPDEDLDLSDLDDEPADLGSALERAAAAIKPIAAPLRLPELPPVKPVTGLRPQVTSGLLNGAGPAQTAEKPVTGSRPQVTSGPLTGAGAEAGSGRPVSASRPQISAPQLNGAGPASPELPAVRPPTGARPLVTAPSLAGPPVAGSVPAARPITTGTNPMLRAPATSPPRPPPAPIGTQDGLSDSKIKAIYEAYVMAKKRCGEDTRSLTLDSVSSSLKKQVPELMKQHNARSVEFKVVIKDGKAVLRALPKDT